MGTVTDMRVCSAAALASALLFGSVTVRAHTGMEPSVYDAVVGITDRLRATLSESEFRGLNRDSAERLLTRDERRILGSAHIHFEVNQPVLVTVFRDRSLETDPFWLRNGRWELIDQTVKVGGTTFDLWQKEFRRGEVGLGINSLGGGGRHYFVSLAPRGREALEVSNLYPGQLEFTNPAVGAPPWIDREDLLESLPGGFEGQTLVQTMNSRRDDGRLVGRLQWTDYPSSESPDHVVLTWSGDPTTSQAIQWRTARAVITGAVLFTEADRGHEPLDRWRRVEALTTTLPSVTTANDPVVNRHTVELTGLQPGTQYAYRVGDGSEGGWSMAREFKTAPAEAEPFSFVYMGDAQNGLDTWGRLVRGAYQARPDVAFYLMAGDMVNRGNQRDDWDSFFHNAAGVFDRRTLVPVIGNHECQGGHPAMFLEQFALPLNGPPGQEPERAYSFEYSNALFVVLDSNQPADRQAGWLEEQLSGSDAHWKIVSYHHPAYSSGPRRDNKSLREAWTPIFDRYHVDLALQGHDHAYLRTHPMRGGQPVDDLAAGTTYIISVSGTKMYTQAERPETLVGLTNVATWQVLDLEIAGNRLRYRAYDHEGRVRDEFVINKGLLLGQPSGPGAEGSAHR
jgi:hypothetical protein